tara:strand:+ start:792 stop:1523 length:732 start_codon:yes stop_codon:yes gene_type:complete
MNKIRLDQLLVNRSLVESKEKAQKLIYGGLVKVNEILSTKPGHKFNEDCKINIKQKEKYVSRGGLKFEEAYDKFNLKIKNNICLDIGSSTGGFTDFMLQHKADRIYAVDCGTNQLHWTLRKNSKIIVMEKTNARYLSKKEIPELVDLCTIDVSFISLKKILPSVINLINNNGVIVSLIKPQFEAGKDQIDKGGVITNPIIHEKVINDIKDFGEKKLNLKWLDFCISPLKGPAGNKEFFAHWRK